MALTVPDAARRVGRNPETVRRWIREGRLRAHKVGTQHVIDDADLDEATHATRGRPAATVDAWLPMIVGRIVRAADPAKVVLLGSRVGGEAREDSDYDLLVIVDAAPNRRALRAAIRRSFSDLAVAADVVVATTEEAAGRIPGRPAGVAYWALQGGHAVYERGDAP